MLMIYRRHVKSCKHRGDGRSYRRCRCPIHVQGIVGGESVRESLKLVNWQQAQVRIRDWEAEDEVLRAPEPMTVEQAAEAFLADAAARQLSEATLYKYRLLFDRLGAFAEGEGRMFLRDLDLSSLRRFRSTWTDSPISALKKLERLRAFLRFAQEAGWIEENPAARLKKPKVSQRPTLPYTLDEMIRILEACKDYPDGYGETGQANAQRLRAFVLLLRYSGLRIGDAVTLRRDQIQGGLLFLYTAKTDVPVYLPLPDFVTQALAAVIGTHAEFFFWSGESKVKSAVGDWQRSLRKLFKLARVDDGHAHRFRDTFAVELLLKDIPLERVSMTLGHRSIKVTEQHYAPWVRARQSQLEADVRRSWGEDPLHLAETNGTPEVREDKEVAKPLIVQ